MSDKVLQKLVCVSLLAGCTLALAVPAFAAGDAAQAAVKGKTMSDATASNSALVAQVKKTIMKKYGLNAQAVGINIRAVNGVIVLTGHIKSSVWSDQAQAAAETVDGVKAVDNKLQFDN